MNDTEHSAIIREGPEVWNRWRHENPDVKPDLTGLWMSGREMGRDRLVDMGWEDPYPINLRGVDLSSATLSRCHVHLVDMRGANLRNATIRNGVLSSIDFNDANLSRIELRDTRVTGCRFQDASFADSFLAGVIVESTDLANVDLASARMQGVSFTDCNLVDVRCAEEADIRSPIAMDYLTLKNSPSMPRALLEGAGFPDEWISYLVTLAGKPVQFYSCFISYSTQDAHLVKRIHSDLQAGGVRCWLAEEDLRAGDVVFDSVMNAIRTSDKMVVVLSASSLKSHWVEREIRRAYREEERRGEPVLIPIMLDREILTDDREWASLLRERWIADFSSVDDAGRYDGQIAKLMAALRTASARYP